MSAAGRFFGALSNIISLSFILDTLKQLVEVNQKHLRIGISTFELVVQQKSKIITNGKLCQVTRCRKSTEWITSSVFIPVHRTTVLKASCRSSVTIIISRKLIQMRKTTTKSFRLKSSRSLPAARRTAATDRWRLQVRRHCPIVGF